MQNNFFQRAFFVALGLSLALRLQSVAQDAKNYFPPEKIDPIALLMPPPLAGSPEQDGDLQEVRFVHDHCSSNDFAAAKSQDAGVFIFYFEPLLGDFLQANKFPVMQAFLQRVHHEAKITVTLAKNYWKRPRPYTMDSRLLVGKVEKSFSYPSGHSTESMTLALVLADLFPDKREALIATAREIGWHRVEIARHYPTDIFAGRVLAQAIVRELKTNPEFQKDFAAAQKEIAEAKKTF